MLYIALFNFVSAWAFQNYVAERDPPLPAAKEQYRLFFRTPGSACSKWRKIVPNLEKADMLLTESRRDEKAEKGKEAGCRFLWVITPAAPPGAMRFELEGITGPKETFEVPAPQGYKPPPSALPSSPSASLGIPGIANENGTGPATTAPKGSLKIPGIGIDSSGKPADPGTGK